MFFIVSMTVELSVVCLSVGDCCGLRWVVFTGRMGRYVGVYCCCAGERVGNCCRVEAGEEIMSHFRFWPYDQLDASLTLHDKIKLN